MTQPVAWQGIVAAWRAEIDAELPPDINMSQLEAQRRVCDEVYRQAACYGLGTLPGHPDHPHLSGEPDGTDICDECLEDLVLVWLERRDLFCDHCQAPLQKDQLRFACTKCDFDLCHACSIRVADWSNSDLAQADDRWMIAARLMNARATRQAAFWESQFHHRFLSTQQVSRHCTPSQGSWAVVPNPLCGQSAPKLMRVQQCKMGMQTVCCVAWVLSASIHSLESTAGMCGAPAFIHRPAEFNAGL